MLIALRLVILSLAACMHSPLSVYAGAEAGSPAQWPNLSDYLKAATDEMEMMRTRNSGFFWDPTKAPGFDLDSAKGKMNSLDAECAIVVYYDRVQSRMNERGSGSSLSNPAGAPTYTWPLAIAPICQNATKQTSASDYPAPTSVVASLVFWGPHSDTSQDAYLILPVGRPTAELADLQAAGVDTDCIVFTHQSPASIQWGASHQDENDNHMLGFELMDWLLTFAKSAGEKPGCLPDPYIRVKGDKLWPAWSANDFYGYDEEDRRISLANRPT